ncbi:hypothetical protein BB170200_00852 [Mycobacterium marinum]|nr:hypothetical protein BB170200_00852 [Mycobacterium marinum]
MYDPVWPSASRYGLLVTPVNFCAQNIGSTKNLTSFCETRCVCYVTARLFEWPARERVGAVKALSAR